MFTKRWLPNLNFKQGLDMLELTFDTRKMKIQFLFFEFSK